MHSLWLPIGFQALVTSYLLVRTIMHLLPTTFGRRVGLSLLVLMMTVATTGVARYVSYVMPDILATWIVLGGSLVIFARRRLERAIAGLTIVLSVVVHNSNLPLGIAFGVVVLGTTACLRPSIDVRRLRDLLAVLVLGAATAAVMNWALGAGFTLSRGAPTFMVNRLAAAGVVSQRLETYCPQVGWQLCTSQQVIRQPHTDAGWWFLWGDDSPLRTLGWEQGGGEQSDVVRHALQCCLGSILHANAESSWQQQQQFTRARMYRDWKLTQALTTLFVSHLSQRISRLSDGPSAVRPGGTGTTSAWRRCAALCTVRRVRSTRWCRRRCGQACSRWLRAEPAAREMRSAADRCGRCVVRLGVTSEVGMVGARAVDLGNQIDNGHRLALRMPRRTQRTSEHFRRLSSRFRSDYRAEEEWCADSGGMVRELFQAYATLEGLE